MHVTNFFGKIKEAAILTMKMLTGTCLWSINVIPENVKDIYVDFSCIQWSVDAGEKIDQWQSGKSVQKLASKVHNKIKCIRRSRRRMYCKLEPIYLCEFSTKPKMVLDSFVVPYYLGQKTSRYSPLNIHLKLFDNFVIYPCNGTHRRFKFTCSGLRPLVQLAF